MTAWCSRRRTASGRTSHWRNPGNHRNTSPLKKHRRNTPLPGLSNAHRDRKARNLRKERDRSPALHRLRASRPQRKPLPCSRCLLFQHPGWCCTGLGQRPHRHRRSPAPRGNPQRSRKRRHNRRRRRSNWHSSRRARPRVRRRSDSRPNSHTGRRTTVNGMVFAFDGVKIGRWWPPGSWPGPWPRSTGRWPPRRSPRSQSAPGSASSGAALHTWMLVKLGHSAVPLRWAPLADHGARR